jgi:hypothetical protein
MMVLQTSYGVEVYIEKLNIVFPSTDCYLLEKWDESNEREILFLLQILESWSSFDKFFPGCEFVV